MYKCRDGFSIFELRVDVNLERVDMLLKGTFVGSVEFVKLNKGDFLA